MKAEKLKKDLKQRINNLLDMKLLRTQKTRYSGSICGLEGCYFTVSTKNKIKTDHPNGHIENE